MKKILLTIVVLFVTTSTNLFSAENSCSQYKKWNLPTGKYNECIKNLKKKENTNRQELYQILVKKYQV